MNDKHIQAILTVLKEGSITAGAKKLFVSQPSLSQMIKNAEANLGAPIFDRSTDPITLTAAGELYVDAARQVQTINVNLAKQIEELQKEEFGTIRLGLPIQQGMEILPKIYPLFRSRFPHVSLELLEVGSSDIEKILLEGGVDIACLTTSPRHEELVYSLIQREELVLLANRETELAKRVLPGTPLDVTEAAGEVFICIKKGHSVRTLQDSLFISREISPSIGLETESIEVGKRVVASTRAVMVCPDSYTIRDNPADCGYVVYPLLGAENTRHFYACYRKDLYLTRYMKGFLDILQELAAKTPAQAPRVELADMLTARERRAAIQRDLLSSCQAPVISFTMNIPGPVKLLPHVTDAFQDGARAVEEALSRRQIPLLRREMIREKTGWEAFFCADASPETLKEITVAIEDRDPVGRLYDMDVIRTDGSKVSREDLHLPGRKCLLCGEPAHACARSRRHSVEELTEEIQRILAGRYGR